MNQILLVEDEDFNRDVIEDIFAFDEIHSKLTCAKNGEEAIKLAAELEPILILMDIGLPGMDGLETTRRLKQDPRTKDIPVWALTAHAMQGDENNALAAGCSTYFTKPINVKSFARQLREFVSKDLAIGGESCTNY